VLDGAGWHTAPLNVPDDICLVHLPPYTPELRLAETLWVHIYKPIVNRHFGTLEDLHDLVAERCITLAGGRIRTQARFHWWPDRFTAT
jgi:transposase